MRSLVVALAAVFCFACAEPRPLADDSRDERRDLLELVARGYYPGRSGQIFFVPEPGEVFLRKPMGYYRFMHGSPWDYDRHIPMLFYGPGVIVAGSYEEPTIQQDVTPTILKLLGLPPPATMSGRTLDFLLQENGSAPRVVLVGVLDGMRVGFFERYADAMPNLSRMRRDGAWLEQARVNYMPTVTSAGHTTIATGADPRVHGIAGNGFFDRRRGGYATLFEKLSPNNIMALGLADLWNISTDGRAVIITQGTTPRATVSLGGHGGCTPNARPTILAMFDYRKERFVTNADCFVLPDYLDGHRARPVWEEAGGKWRDIEIERGRDFVTTALFPDFQVDALIEMIEREPVGEDALTDLVLVNFKTPDYVGHFYGPESDEMGEALAALDGAIGRAREAIEDAAGDRGYVIVLTADHGTPSEPEGNGHERHFISELNDRIHDEFDPNERRLLLEYLDTANLQLYVDELRLAELGHDLRDVASFLEELAYIKAAFTEPEVRAVSFRHVFARSK